MQAIESNMVGKLIYLSHTRPNIDFAFNRVSQYMHSPTKSHLEDTYRILKYLKWTPGCSLFFRKTKDQNVELYTNTDSVVAIEDRISTSGYYTLVYGNLVTWRSKRKPL